MRTLVLLGLLLAALLSLFFSVRHNARPANPVPQAAPHAVEARQPPVNAARARKKRAVKKPEDTRKKRVSPLIDPGEALIGSASTAPAASASGLKGKNK